MAFGLTFTIIVGAVPLNVVPSDNVPVIVPVPVTASDNVAVEPLQIFVLPLRTAVGRGVIICAIADDVLEL